MQPSGIAAMVFKRAAVAGIDPVDPAARTVTVDGRPIDLQPKEFTLLQELLLNAGRVLSREQLEERLYRWGEEVESNAVEVHVHQTGAVQGIDAGCKAVAAHCTSTLLASRDHDPNRKSS